MSSNLLANRPLTLHYDKFYCNQEACNHGLSVRLRIDKRRQICSGCGFGPASGATEQKPAWFGTSTHFVKHVRTWNGAPRGWKSRKGASSFPRIAAFE